MNTKPLPSAKRLYAPGNDTVLIWHEVARALTRGAHHRPELPRELVLSIFAYAELFVPAGDLGVSQCYWAPHSGTWFTTPTLDVALLKTLAAVQLHTISPDLAPSYYSNNYSECTWFELGIQSCNSSDGSWKDAGRPHCPLRWMSHYSPADNGPCRRLEGTFFGPGHDLWSMLQPGDRLAVHVCAKYHKRNNTKSGRLRFWRFFEPTIF